MGLIQKGCTRIVLTIGKIAIKIPNFRYSWQHFVKGILANIEEKNTWRISNIEDCELYKYKDLICPVIWASWGCIVLIMKRCERELSDEEFLSLDLSPYNKISLGDNKSNNFMWLDGRVVKVDYPK